MQTRKKTLCFLLWLPFCALFTLRCDCFWMLREVLSSSQTLVRLSWIAVLTTAVVFVSARCLRLDYTEASAKHPNSGEAERLQRSFQITGSETQKWISSSKMKTEAGVESFPKCLCMTVCLFQPFLSYAYCVKLLILLHKHRKCKNVRILAAVWIEALQLPASSFFKFKDGLSDSFQNCCCLAVNVCVCGPSKMLSVRSLSFQ